MNAYSLNNTGWLINSSCHNKARGGYKKGEILYQYLQPVTANLVRRCSVADSVYCDKTTICSSHLSKSATQLS